MRVTVGPSQRVDGHGVEELHGEVCRVHTATVPHLTCCTSTSEQRTNFEQKDSRGRDIGGTLMVGSVSDAHT